MAEALHVHIAPVCASMRMQSLLAIIWLELHLLAQPVNVLSHLCGILVSMFGSHRRMSVEVSAMVVANEYANTAVDVYCGLRSMGDILELP